MSTDGAPLAGLLTELADLEFAAVQQHRRWLDEAPTLEDRWYLAQTQRDQLGAARSLTKVLEHLGGGPEALHRLMFAKGPAHLRPLGRTDLDHWADVLAYQVLAEEAQLVFLPLLTGAGPKQLDRYLESAAVEKAVHVRWGLIGLRRCFGTQDPPYAGGAAAARGAITLLQPPVREAFDHLRSMAVGGGLLSPEASTAAAATLTDNHHRALAGLGLPLSPQKASR